MLQDLRLSTHSARRTSRLRQCNAMIITTLRRLQREKTCSPYDYFVVWAAAFIPTTIHSLDILRHRGSSIPNSSDSVPTTADNSNSDSSNLNNMQAPNNAVEQFDALRREATKLERILEDKLAKYQQLSQKLLDSDSSFSILHRSSSPSDASLETGSAKWKNSSGTAPHSNNNTNNNASSTQQQQRKEDEEQELQYTTDIQRTLSSLTDLIQTQMAPLAEKTGKSQHSLLVKRYREILFDSTADYKKIHANMARRRETLELFRASSPPNSLNSPLNNNNNGEGNNPEMDYLFRERNAIGNSMRSATSVLGQAAQIHDNLRHQGQSLRTVGGTVVQMASHVPGLNYLIDAIRRRRSREDTILSLVIASCILFTLWYIFG